MNIFKHNLFCQAFDGDKDDKITLDDIKKIAPCVASVFVGMYLMQLLKLHNME